ncbi:hypothetical protein IV203_038168 [Nitzschia inconspicua]|uniref:Uncharacterized protein n=1 Tax=Nitzschia inconspicua TaxID=303405 RepID=A0A9K3LN83_9STRA|nr:hypothetical protein IV203_038168 [Nitzschia inconspicua]
MEALSTPQETELVEALVDDILHADLSFSTSSEGNHSPRASEPIDQQEEEYGDDKRVNKNDAFDLPSGTFSPRLVGHLDEEVVNDTGYFLQPNEDGLIVEFCTTFATVTSDAGSVVAKNGLTSGPTDEQQEERANKNDGFNLPSDTFSPRLVGLLEEEVTNERKQCPEPNEDGLIVEFCTTFATETSEAGSIVAKNGLAAMLQIEFLTSATETTTDQSQTTITESEQDPPGFLGRFFTSRKKRAEAKTRNEFDVEEITIADDSKDNYSEELADSTMADSDSDIATDSTDGSSKQSYLYEAATVGFPFLASTGTLSVAEQSTATSRSSSISFSESRDDFTGDSISQTSSLSCTETRDDSDLAFGSMSPNTMDDDKEDYGSVTDTGDFETVAETGMSVVQEPRTGTLKVSGLITKAIEPESDSKISEKPAAAKMIKQVRKWFPWQIGSRRQESSSFDSQKLGVIRESEEEVLSIMEQLHIDGSDDTCTKRKIQRFDEDYNKKRKSTSEVSVARSKAGPELEKTSFGSNDKKGFVP